MLIRKVDAEPAAGSEGALGVVEHEVLGLDAAVDEWWVVAFVEDRVVAQVSP
jgi:hypothetical protein